MINIAAASLKSPIFNAPAWSNLTISSGLHEAVVEGEGGGRGARGHREFAEDVQQVPGDMVLARPKPTVQAVRRRRRNGSRMAGGM
jgi:hypothetical protein